MKKVKEIMKKMEKAMNEGNWKELGRLSAKIVKIREKEGIL